MCPIGLDSEQNDQQQSNPEIRRGGTKQRDEISDKIADTSGSDSRINPNGDSHAGRYEHAQQGQFERAL